MIKDFPGFEELPKIDKDSLIHYAGTVAYYFGLRIHARMFPNPEDRQLFVQAGIRAEQVISEKEQLVQKNVPGKFIEAAGLNGLTIAIEMIVERTEQAQRNTQDLYRRTA